MTDKIDNYPDIKSIIKAIRKKEIVDYYEVPEELRNNHEIVKEERKLKVRTISARGYDVLRNVFFVNELVNKVSSFDGEIYQRPIVSEFETFEEYYDFLCGEIYEDACYFNYVFPENLIRKYDIDVSKLNFVSLISETIDDCIPQKYEFAEEDYDAVEKNKRNLKRWISKFNNCKTYTELAKINENHRKSSDGTDEAFYLWNYINSKGEAAFDVVMKFVNAGCYPAYKIESALPFIFEPKRAEEAYDYKLGAKSTCAKHKTQFRAYIRRIKEEGYYTEVSKYFSKNTHFYCIRTDYFFVSKEKFHHPCASVYQYFEDFSSFSEYLNYDLSDCDLTYAREIIIDSSYTTNDNTRLPIDDISALKKVVEKTYDRYKEEFSVKIKWKNSYDRTVFSEHRNFRYFFDFLAYLKNDLSEADLLYCVGLSNLSDYTGIDFTGALMTSKSMDALGIGYKRISAIKTVPVDNEVILKNEQTTALALSDNHLELPFEIGTSGNCFSDNKVYYISDIHLIHKLIRKKAKTKADIIFYVQRIVDDILRGLDALWECKTLLIGGDISSEYTLFELFVELLRKTIDMKSYDVTVIFVLGNHELWNHKDESLSNIVNQYRACITSRRMYLLHDEVLYIENQDNVSYITKEELYSEDVNCLRSRVRKARLIMFGGIGFAGCNELFNANNGIYRDTIGREQEVELSSDFSDLYDRVETVFGDRNIVVFTHMNINEWKSNYKLHDKWIYVSGHSHINSYYDDGSTRLYADNQIGYYNDKAQLKYFLIDNSYDWFTDYADGIYEISRNDYIEFYRGKNIQITFNRDAVKIYMLKRHGYYCFIQENKSGKLTMLNGGALKALSSKNIEYYYQNMDAEIEYIKTPLLKYQEYQKAISEEIKKLGGNGRIHGAIIDIDGNDDLVGWSSIAYNHLYINPIDLTITPYFALDMVLKYVYPSFPALLSDKCPKLFESYKSLLTDSGKNSIMIRPVDQEELMIKPVLYTDTDIYKASRELRKMQKLNSNILSTWFDKIPNLVALPELRRSISNQAKYLGMSKKMTCGMEATIIEYNGYSDVTVRFEDGTIVEHANKYVFDRGGIWNPSIERPKPERKPANYRKSSYVGKTQMMKCGMTATVIEDFGCNDITVQFEDGLVRRHKRRDKFREGKIAHIEDFSEM